MSPIKALTIQQMARRIYERPENQFVKHQDIVDILKLYMDECRKAMIRGERVQLAGVGTIIPEVKSSKTHNLPVCNKEDRNTPYTKIRFRRTNTLKAAMNTKLMTNISKGIWGLEQLAFTFQQMNILKQFGWYPEPEDKDEEE